MNRYTRRSELWYNKDSTEYACRTLRDDFVFDDSNTGRQFPTVIAVGLFPLTILHWPLAAWWGFQKLDGVFVCLHL